MELQGKKVILGVSGSIAAYKAAFLLRLLVKAGAEVQVVITPSGKEFITPVTLSALSGRPVICDFFGKSDGTWNSHVDLGLWADVMIVAPATASTLGKMANGIADNMLIATYMSVRCPVFVAPAMDLDMFAHPSTQKNLSTLKEIGVSVIEPAVGELASHLEGKGRMEEPERILDMLIAHFSQKKKLLTRKFLVSAGPTFERIDPVRFIGNFSTGKMGYAIAEALAGQGAEVVLVSGPVAVTTSHNNIQVIHVESAKEMHKACMQIFPSCDGAVMTAAVADYTPVHAEMLKVKRTKENYSIELQPTQDIAAELGDIKKAGQLLVGFALETHNESQNALLKLQKKNLDFIVLNTLNDSGAGFGYDTNKITIIDKNNNIVPFELKTKKEVAGDIVNYIISVING